MSDQGYPYEEIAPRLRALREDMDLSPEALGAKVDVSAAEVLAFESGEGEIPVSYLFKVAQVGGIDLTALITGGEAHLKTYTIVRDGGGLSVERRKDYSYQSLAYRFTGRSMEPFLVTVPAKEPSEMKFHTHPGQEFIYVLKGRLEIRLGENIEVLEPADCLYFDSLTPHSLRGLDGEAAEFLDVII